MQQEIKWQGGRAVGDSAPVTITALLLQATLFLGNKASSSCHCFETVSGQKEIYNFPKQQLQEQQEKKTCTFGKKQCRLETKTSLRHSLSVTGSPVSLHHWHTRGRERKKKKVSRGRQRSLLFWQEIVKRRDSEHVSTEEGGTEERVMCVYARMKE